MESKQKYTILAAAGLALSTIAVVSAANVKAFHGATCLKSNIGTGGTVYPSVDGAVSSGSDNDVVCPLVRDRINATNNLTTTAVELYKTSSSATWCWLYTQKEDGGGFVHDYASGTVTGTGFQQINFSGVGTSNGNEGSYSVKCQLVDGDTVLHVYIYEDNGVD
jgi:hypothetical protein